MADLLIRMTEEVKAQLREQSEKQKRSMTSYILNLIDQDIKGERIVKVKVEKWDEYWKTEAGIEQSR